MKARDFATLIFATTALSIVGAGCGSQLDPLAARSAALHVPSGSRDSDLRDRSASGFIPVEGGNVFYKIVGTGHGTPLLTLHGGPGIPHNYLESLTPLGDDRPIIYYDQLGCGQSDRPTDAALWTIDRFVTELHQVRQFLHLHEVVLYGHSWGTMLGMEYLRHHHGGVKGVIFAGPALSVARWQADAERLIEETLTPEEQQVVAAYNQGQVVDPQAYQAAVDHYDAQHLCRLSPPPQLLVDSLNGMNPDIYNLMDGPNEFTITGTLKDYDATRHLGRLRLPTLFVAGRFDEATPETTRFYAHRVPHADVAIIEDASHLANLEQPEAYNGKLRDWLRALDSE